MFPRLVSVLLATSAALCAQRGDSPGEEQPPLPASVVVPPAPVLSPEQALGAFRLAPGLRIELVAAEPLVHDPVAVTFGPDGRLWVVEMRGYMPDVDGKGELEPNGRIVVLRDRDDDGRMDESSVFLDGLVLPRAIALCGDGVLVIEPPSLYLWRDTDGDGRGDAKEKISDGFEAGLANVEHAGNSLLWGLDNWLHLAKFPGRFAREGDQWRRAPALGGGQWGLSRDDQGRLFYNYNSDWLRADLYPSHYALRNREHGRARGVNVQIGRNQSVWPGRVTPGVNRGYRKGLLAEGRLTRFTAVCAPLVYRGDAIAQMRGDVFACEPSGNLLRRGRLEMKGNDLRAHNAYDKGEFLTSTDERFRPVNLCDGPDGALYVVDMYRGIIQHRNFVTSWLRKQILERGLDQPLGLGRIYRIVPADWRRPPSARLDALDGRSLVGELAHANGWRRDTAQRLLVERGGGDVAVARALRAAALGAEEFATRLHALWTLAGRGELDRYAVLTALGDGDARVRAHAIRLAEPWLRNGDFVLLGRLCAMVGDAERSVLLQLAATLGECTEPPAQVALLELVVARPDDADLRSVVVSGLRGRELEFLTALRDRDGDTKGRAALVSALARCVVRGKDPQRTEQLLLQAGADAHGRAVLGGAVAGLPKGDARKGSLPLPSPSAALGHLGAIADVDCAASIAVLTGAATAVAGPRPLTVTQRERFTRGRAVYLRDCGSCHLATGTGMGGQAPALADSEWVLGSTERLVRVVLHGLTGPIEVGGEPFNGSMPGWAGQDDETLASVLTYLRRAWGHAGEPIDPQQVRAIREATRQRRTTWTAPELAEFADR